MSARSAEPVVTVSTANGRLSVGEYTEERSRFEHGKWKYVCKESGEGA
jgi:hypothetical protein